MDENGITFKWNDYRRKNVKRYTSMTLTADEFIRRFLILIHVLPSGFHRLRHYGLIANANRQDNLAHTRKLPGMNEAELPVQEETTDKHQSEEPRIEEARQDASYSCPDCGAPMIIIETFLRKQQPRAPLIKQGRT